MPIEEAFIMLRALGRVALTHRTKGMIIMGKRSRETIGHMNRSKGVI